MAETLYKVSEVARLANVTVRTLHHYDEIGLLRPSGRSGAGYRLYSESDLLRLHQIVVGRSLGLALEEIRRTLDDPTVDRVGLLREQRRALAQQIEDTHAKIRAIDAALRRLDPTAESSTPMTAEEIETMFEGFDPSEYEDEARQRWGRTEAYAESTRRTKHYGPDDWARNKAEAAEIYAALAQRLADGTPADDPAAMDLAERHRLHIDQWFYPCSVQMHGNLASMYEADDRFAATFEKVAPGLTAYFVAAIRANAKRRD